MGMIGPISAFRHCAGQYRCKRGLFNTGIPSLTLGCPFNPSLRTAHVICTWAAVGQFVPENLRLLIVRPERVQGWMRSVYASLQSCEVSTASGKIPDLGTWIYMGKDIRYPESSSTPAGPT